MSGSKKKSKWVPDFESANRPFIEQAGTWGKEGNTFKTVMKKEGDTIERASKRNVAIYEKQRRDAERHGKELTRRMGGKRG